MTKQQYEKLTLEEKAKIALMITTDRNFEEIMKLQLKIFYEEIKKQRKIKK